MDSETDQQTEKSEPRQPNSKPKNSQQKLRSKQRTRKSQQTANPDPEERTRTIGVGPSKHRTSALQRIPLQSGGASPSLKVRAMEWHNFAEILFGLAAVITALKQGGKKK
ncbi:hypothetical protein [Sphingomonas morindae]|uniref:Uncharacterized protein n=1 Tax=Sphingomonas morindae TaxID=1541170 RepID=A0ABY4XEG5_9SPHN|nr:hypothetical protein [Sphingomonas morindae]USI75213.1 hypothetical protein LHA26_19455 [Sphingomonas morindae]